MEQDLLIIHCFALQNLHNHEKEKCPERYCHFSDHSWRSWFNSNSQTSAYPQAFEDQKVKSWWAPYLIAAGKGAAGWGHFLKVTLTLVKLPVLPGLWLHPCCPSQLGCQPSIFLASRMCPPTATCPHGFAKDCPSHTGNCPSPLICHTLLHPGTSLCLHPRGRQGGANPAFGFTFIVHCSQVRA